MNRRIRQKAIVCLPAIVHRFNMQVNISNYYLSLHNKFFKFIEKIHIY